MNFRKSPNWEASPATPQRPYWHQLNPSEENRPECRNAISVISKSDMSQSQLSIPECPPSEFQWMISSYIVHPAYHEERHRGSSPLCIQLRFLFVDHPNEILNDHAIYNWTDHQLEDASYDKIYTRPLWSSDCFNRNQRYCRRLAFAPNIDVSSPKPRCPDRKVMDATARWMVVGYVSGRYRACVEDFPFPKFRQIGFFRNSYW